MFKDYNLDSFIPIGEPIHSVTIVPKYHVDTNESIAELHVQAVVNGVDCPEITLIDDTEPTSDVYGNFDVTSCRNWTRDDLLDGNFSVKVSAI